MYCIFQHKKEIPRFTYHWKRAKPLFYCQHVWSKQGRHYYSKPGLWWKDLRWPDLKIPQKTSNQKEDIFHTIKSGETLYRLTVMYQMSADAICDANPGLSAQNFHIGTVIRIPLSKNAETSFVKEPVQNNVAATPQPRCRETHKVKKKETLYSISKQYGISSQEFMTNPKIKNRGLNEGICAFPSLLPTTKIRKELQPYRTTVICSMPTVPKHTNGYQPSKLRSYFLSCSTGTKETNRPEWLSTTKVFLWLLTV